MTKRAKLPIVPLMSNAQNKPFFIAPVTNPTDEYAAGYDNNRFATREEAEAEIPHLAAALNTEASDWIVSQRKN